MLCSVSPWSSPARRFHYVFLVLTLAVDGGVDFVPRGVDCAADLLDVVPLLPGHINIPARARGIDATGARAAGWDHFGWREEL
jgi:hypothetical protein